MLHFRGYPQNRPFWGHFWTPQNDPFLGVLAKWPDICPFGGLNIGVPAGTSKKGSKMTPKMTLKSTILGSFLDPFFDPFWGYGPLPLCTSPIFGQMTPLIYGYWPEGSGPSKRVSKKGSEKHVFWGFDFFEKRGFFGLFWPNPSKDQNGVPNLIIL